MRTVFLSESVVFPHQAQGKAVPVAREQSVLQAIILQGMNPFSGELLRFAKDMKVAQWVVSFTCSNPQQFLVDLAQANVSAEHMALITCPCFQVKGARILLPKPFQDARKVTGACEDEGAGVMRAMFEQWLAQGSINFQEFSKTG